MNASAWSRHFLLRACSPFYGRVARAIVASLLAALACLATAPLAAQPVTNAAASPNTVPDLRTLLSPPQSEMRVVAQRYQADRGNLSRYYSVTLSPEYYSRFKLFYSDWLAAVRKLDAAKSSEDGRVEQTRLAESIQRDLSQLDERAKTVRPRSRRWFRSPTSSSNSIKAAAGWTRSIRRKPRPPSMISPPRPAGAKINRRRSVGGCQWQCDPFDGVAGPPARRKRLARCEMF